MLCTDVGELVVPVGLAVEGLLLQPRDWVILRLVVDPEVGGLGQEVITIFECLNISSVIHNTGTTFCYMSL